MDLNTMTVKELKALQEEVQLRLDYLSKQEKEKDWAKFTEAFTAYLDKWGTIEVEINDCDCYKCDSSDIVLKDAGYLYIYS